MLDLAEHKKTDHIPLRVDEGGAVRIGETQVTLDVLMGAYDRGATAEEIAERFGELDLADVYAVIAYYLRHEADVRRYLAERGAEAQGLREEIERDPANQRLRERLRSAKRRR